MSLCLAAGLVGATVAADAFTLAWTHSIEKQRWEEDWRVAGHHLVIDAARIRGTGAGMEPPADAVLRAGVWHYRPTLPPQAALRLSHSPHAGGYALCTVAGCRPLADWLPGLGADASIELRPCPDPAQTDAAAHQKGALQPSPAEPPGRSQATAASAR